MIADDFGVTFLGRHWLDLISLLNPDEEIINNGKTIAEREAVADMIFETGGIRAGIDESGEHHTASIGFTAFTPNLKTKLADFIRRNRNTLPDIFFSILSEEHYRELQQNKIVLIPSNRKNITVNCSCGNPDVCEHIITLIYSSAAEIEKNPSLLFKLRGFDLKSVFQDKNSDSGIIKFSTLKSRFTPYKNVPVSVEAAKDGEGFHIEAVNILSIFKLLPEKPLFYPREDFRTLLLEKYKAYAGYAADYPETENKTNINLNGYDFFLAYYDSSEMEQHNNTSEYASAFLINRMIPNLKNFKDEEVTVPLMSEQSLEPAVVTMRRVTKNEILKFFLSIPLNLSSQSNSPSSRFLNAASTVALVLIKNYAYVPEVRFVNNEEFIVNYCPLAANSSIRDTLEILRSLAPPNLVIRKKDSAVLKNDIHIHILQLFINYIIHSYESRYGRKHYFSGQKMYSTFFKGEVFRPDKYDEYQNGLQAALWLEKLSYLNMSTKPVLTFRDKSEDEYEISLAVKNEEDNSIMRFSNLLQKSEHNNNLEALRSRIIRQLNHASEHFPLLSGMIDNSGAVPVNLSAKEMYGFIKKTEPLLSLLGILCDIPSEMKMRKAPHAVLAARLKKFSGLNTNTDIKSLIEFEWQINVGDKLIPVDEYFRLAAQEEGLINIDGNYFVNDPSNNEHIMNQVKNKPPSADTQSILRVLLSGEFNGSKISSETDVNDLLQSLFSIKETELPENLRTELRDYQVRGYSWLYSKLKKGLGLCLADDMGLGKTVQVIAVLLKFKSEKFNKLPVLIICPTSLVANWNKELEKFAPSLKVFIYHGSRRRFEFSRKDIILTTYGIIRNENEKFKKYNWDFVILDEAQNIKNWESEQSKSVKMLDSTLHLAMSGTPVENRLTELWSIFDFINKDFLGTYHHFRSNYAIPIEKYGDTDKLLKLRQITSPFVLRRLKNDPDVIDDLPDKIELDEYCYLTNEQMKLYKNTITDIFNQISHSNKNQRSGYILNLITYLKQICNHPSLFTKERNIDFRLSGKTEKMLDLVTGFLDRNEKSLIFTQYKEMGDILCKILKYEHNINPLFFHGSLSVKKRNDLVEQFQNTTDNKLMIVSIKAGGTGLNLTAAERVIHFDLWWNPAVENQATDRTYRIGQDKNVTVHRLISVNTFEEKIDKMLKQKKELADLAVISGEPALSELSNKELKQLFKLDH